MIEEVKQRGPMKITSFRINKKFSTALIAINGRHGKIKCPFEDRIYFIISGKGRFMLKNKWFPVAKGSVVFVTKNAVYDLKGKMKYFLVCSPEFNRKHDVHLD